MPYITCYASPIIIESVQNEHSIPSYKLHAVRQPSGVGNTRAEERVNLPISVHSHG